MRRIALIIASLMLVLLAGCANNNTPQDVADNDPQSAASKRAEDPLVGVQPADLKVLDPAQKREKIGPTFPPEIPVPDGEFTEAGDQQEAWNYTVVIDGPTDRVAAWYRSAYTQKNWEVVAQAGSPDGAYVLDLYKGGAQSHIRIIHAAAGGTRAEVTIGVGPDILGGQ